MSRYGEVGLPNSFIFPELTCLGAYVGAQMLFLLVGNWPIDYFGRRPMLWLTQILMLAAAIIELFATNWTHWLGAKILNVSSISYRPRHISLRKLTTKGNVSRMQRFERNNIHL